MHGCQMKCNNFAGGYNCSCNQGYYLTSNGRDCSGNTISVKHRFSQTRPFQHAIEKCFRALHIRSVLHSAIASAAQYFPLMETDFLKPRRVGH